ncbi:KLTH0D16940p [Lachancea thermotolerans CBS 6340]|uniref:KLTH0D16940p n=1 Tax=Lachancea thermotolerans (strain ATCC 56472 / CBS 6340 / NRRL Y-8284) TaxID=559295 RepID=C5DFQ0_LACTC|nr:KLTH0D16940p [Lachancea thermotolerans CBS 6340]CAR23005.1 KLTH0D16940p [Lachancea thermotolerans CBS 6340]
MSTLQQQNEHTAPIASPVAWYSSSVFLVAVRVAQFASTITALGLLAYLLNGSGSGGFELAVPAISLTYLVVVASATLPLNLFAAAAVAVFEVAIFALWIAASGRVGVAYGQYNCAAVSSWDDYEFYYDFDFDYDYDLGTACRAGQAAIAFAAFSALLSACALCLLCVNVLIPLNTGFVGGVRPEGAGARLRRFTALAIARAETAGDVEARASHVIEAPVPVTSGAPHVTETPAPVASDSVPHVTRGNNPHVTETPDPVAAPEPSVGA